MASPAPRRKTSTLSSLILPLCLLAAVALGGVTLWSSGVFRAPAPPSRVQPPGTTPVVLAAVNIPRYTAITRDHLWDASKGHFAFAFVPTSEITSSMLTNWPQLAGRVLNHDKPAGYGFNESDFYPRGTRPGDASAVPPGKRGMRFEASKIAGVAGFRAGDHFDVTSTIAIDPGVASINVGGAFKQQFELQKGMTNFKKQATVRVIVQNGVIVEPMTTRQQATSSADLMNGLQTKMKPIQELVVAVDPEEVGPLTEAFAVGAQLEMILRSSRSDDPQTSRTPDHVPHGPFSESAAGDTLIPPLGFVQTIEGSERGVRAVPVAPPARSSDGKSAEK